MEIHTNDPDLVARRVLKWFHGPVERYVKQEHGIISAIVLTTPSSLVVLGWSDASRDLISQRLQMGIRAAGSGDRRVIGNAVALELVYLPSSKIILPGG